MVPWLRVNTIILSVLFRHFFNRGLQETINQHHQARPPIPLATTNNGDPPGGAREKLLGRQSVFSGPSFVLASRLASHEAPR